MLGQTTPHMLTDLKGESIHTDTVVPVAGVVCAVICDRLHDGPQRALTGDHVVREERVASIVSDRKETDASAIHDVSFHPLPFAEPITAMAQAVIRITSMKICQNSCQDMGYLFLALCLGVRHRNTALPTPGTMSVDRC